MEQNTFNQGNLATQSPIPNSTGVLVLGILSIVFCCCYGFIGIILGIVAIVLAGKGKELYNANPSAYTEGSLKNLNAGKICAIIGLSLSALALIYYIIIFATMGLEGMSDPNAWKRM